MNSQTARRATAGALIAGVSLVALHAMAGPASATEHVSAEASPTTATNPVLKSSLIKNTKVTLKNDSGHMVFVKMGGGRFDPTKVVPRPLKSGKSTSTENWNITSSEDVGGSVTFLAPTFPWLPTDNVAFSAGNPVVGYPWVKVGSKEHNFSEKETFTYTVAGKKVTHELVVKRDKDLNSAKSFTITILK